MHFWNLQLIKLNGIYTRVDKEIILGRIYSSFWVDFIKKRKSNECILSHLIIHAGFIQFYSKRIQIPGILLREILINIIYRSCSIKRGTLPIHNLRLYVNEYWQLYSFILFPFFLYRC